MTRPIIGTLARYRGDEHPYLRGTDLRIVAVLRGEDVFRTDEEFAAVGGIAPDDRFEVGPWIEAAGRFSWVTSDPLAVDLVFEAQAEGA